MSVQSSVEGQATAAAKITVVPRVAFTETQFGDPCILFVDPLGKRRVIGRRHTSPWCTCAKCHEFDSVVSFGDPVFAMDYCMNLYWARY